MVATPASVSRSSASAALRHTQCEEVVRRGKAVHNRAGQELRRPAIKQAKTEYERIADIRSRRKQTGETNMVHVISKNDGPRREDAEAKHFIAQNRHKIRGIVDCLTGGGRSDLRKPFTGPEFENPVVAATRVRRRSGDPQPYVRINRRVTVADAVSGRQLYFIGDVRWVQDGDRLVLATERNGLAGLLDEDPQERLADLDGFALPDEDAEDELKHQIAVRLGFAPEVAEREDAAEQDGAKR
jgi:hypothetical protein